MLYLVQNSVCQQVTGTGPAFPRETYDSWGTFPPFHVESPGRRCLRKKSGRTVLILRSGLTPTAQCAGHSLSIRPGSIFSKATAEAKKAFLHRGGSTNK